MQQAHDTLTARYRSAGGSSPSQTPASRVETIGQPIPNERGPAGEMSIFGFELGKTYEQQGVQECRRYNREIYIANTRRKREAFCAYRPTVRDDPRRSTCWQRVFNRRLETPGRHPRCPYADRNARPLPERANEKGRFFRRPVYYVGPEFPRFIAPRDTFGTSAGRLLSDFILDENKRLGSVYVRTWANRADEARAALIAKYGTPTRIARDSYLLESGQQVILPRYIWEKPHIYVEFQPVIALTFTKYENVEVVSGRLRDRLLNIPALAAVPVGRGTDFTYGYLRVRLPRMHRLLEADLTPRAPL